MLRRAAGRGLVGAAAVGVVVLGTGAPAGAYEWDLPPGFPVPFVPADNPMTAARVALGRALFFDERLSVTGDFSCASCHRPELAFTDGRPVARGATGERHPRNTPSLLNVGYAASFGWSGGPERTLEAQVGIPLLNSAPVEMGLTDSTLTGVLATLAADAALGAGFRAAYPDELEAGAAPSLAHVERALASYVRSLVAAESPFDDYLYFDRSDGLDAAARRGMQLFFAERFGCAVCHASFNFSGPVRAAGQPAPAAVYHNTGLYAEAPDPGRFEDTGAVADHGAFRAPSLRNVALTAPYMHDGSIATLAEVVRFYAAGGRVVASGPGAGDGRLHPHKRAEIGGFAVTDQEVADLVAFLRSLTSRRWPERPQ